MCGFLVPSFLKPTSTSLFFGNDPVVKILLLFCPFPALVNSTKSFLWSCLGSSVESGGRKCSALVRDAGERNTHMPRLIVTLISVLPHPGNYTHNFLLSQGTWGPPPLGAGGGISCGVGTIIVGIVQKKKCRVIR